MNIRIDMTELRQRVRRLEGYSSSTSSMAVRGWGTGVHEVDGCFADGALLAGGVHDFLWRHMADRAAVMGFVLALIARNAPHGAVLWCGAGDVVPHTQGVMDWGVKSWDRLLFLPLHKKQDALWALEEGVKSGALCAVIGEVCADLTACRRLSLAAGKAGVPCFLIRSAQDASVPGVHSRWQVGSAASGQDPWHREAPGRPRFDVEVMRNRNGRLGHWVLEWHHETGDFHLVAPVAGGALAACPST